MAQAAAGSNIRSVEPLRLAPVVCTALVAIEDVSSPALVAIAGVGLRADNCGIAVERHRVGEIIEVGTISGNELPDQAPGSSATLVASISISRPGAEVYGFIEVSADDDGVHVDGHGIAELISAGAIGRRDLLSLTPIIWPALVTFEDIDGAGLGAVGVAIGRADHDGVTAGADSKAELIRGER